MANEKITQFPVGGNARPTDIIWVVRNGIDYQANIVIGVTQVSSANDDINVANETTTPVLTLNSTINGAASKIVKLNTLGQLGAIDIGVNPLVIDPTTTTNTILNSTLANMLAYGRNASNLNTGTLDNARLSNSVTLMGNDFNGANQLVKLDTNGYLPALNGSLLTGLTKSQVGLSEVQNVDQTNADNITSGTLDDARLSSNVATKTYVSENTVSSIGKENQVSGDIILTGPGVVQDGNTFTFPSAADGGATALIVDSPNNTIEQIGTSTYDDQTKTITVKLQAIGDGPGTVTDVSSSNNDINVATPTTTPVLTLNSTVDGGAPNAGKVLKLKDDGSMGAVPVGANALATNPKTQLVSTIDQALADAYGSIPNIVIANTVFVGKNGTAQGTGAINNLYPTIQAAIDASPANTQIFVYASGLSTNTAYNENLNLKAGQVITGASSQFVVITGSINTPTTGGTCYLENLRLQLTAGNGSTINFLNSTGAMNLQLHNVDVNLYGGTGSCVTWLNTNANSKLLCDGTSAWNVISSANGAKLFTSGAGTAGQVFLSNVSAQVNDSINNVAYSIGGAIRFYHTLDNIYGQVQVANTATFTGTFLTIYTGNVAAMVTNSSGVSSFNSVGMTTTANATANTALVEGAGGFAYFNTAPVNTTTKGFATTLNGGLGAIAIPIYAMRLDSSAIAPFTAGTSDGLIQYDSGNFFVDTLLARFKLVTADNTTNKLLSAWLNYNQTPTNTNKTTTDVLSSSAFYSAMSTITGTNLSWDAVNGKLNASGGGSGGSWAQYSNFKGNGAIDPISGYNTVAIGDINVSTFTASDVQGMTAPITANIPLVQGSIYKVTAVLNVNVTNQPEFGATNLSYNGTVDNPPAYALSTANCGVSYGAIANGVFTSNAGINNFGALTTNAYNNTYSITGYIVTVDFTATPYIVGRTSATTGNVYLYSQIGNNSPQWLLAKISNSITDVQLPFVSKSGNSSGNAQLSFTQPATGSTGNSTVAMGVDNLAMTWDGSTTCNHVAYSNNAMAATPTWNQSTTLANPITSSTWLLQAIGYTGGLAKGVIIDQVSGVTGLLDFASGSFQNGSPFPLTNGQPISLNYGGFGANNAFIATLSASPFIVYTSDNQSGWFNIDLSTKGVVGNVNGIAYNPITNRWVCSAWDGTTNRFYYSNSPTLSSATWTQASGTSNQALTRIVGGYTAGGGYAFAIGCISLTSNVYTTTNDTAWSIPSSVPQYSSVILPYYVGGMFVLAPNFSSNPFVLISNDGINFTQITVQGSAYRCGGVGGNLIVPSTSGATSTSISYAYVFAASGFGNNVPDAVWTGNQEITAGVGNTSGNVQRFVATINNYTQTGTNSLRAITNPVIGITGGKPWFATTILGLCGGETITNVSAQLSYVGNTFVVNLVGTNATLNAAVPQSPGQQGVQQLTLTSYCRATGANPSVKMNVSYADGVNTLLANSTIQVEQV